MYALEYDAEVKAFFYDRSGVRCLVINVYLSKSEIPKSKLRSFARLLQSKSLSTREDGVLLEKEETRHIRAYTYLVTNPADDSKKYVRDYVSTIQTLLYKAKIDYCVRPPYEHVVAAVH